MFNANYLKRGSWNVICDICGKKRKREQCKRGGKGFPNLAYLVCNECWDPVHPWSLPLPIAIDALPVPDARPRPNPVYITPSIWTLSIWGVQYQRADGTIASDLNCEDWDEIIGGPGTLEYNATNFPLV